MIWFVNLAILFAFVKIFEIPPMIPALSAELGVSYERVGVFMSAYALVRCLASSPSGSVTDRWGVMPVISASLFGLVVFDLLGTLGSSYPFLLLMQVLVSICVSAIFIAAVDAIPKMLPAHKVASGIGFINGSINTGIAFALLLTPILIELVDWRWTSRAYTAACFVLFCVSLLFLRQDMSLGSAKQENETSLPMVQLLKNKTVVLLALATGVLFIELYGVLTWLPAYLRDVYGFGPSEVGLSTMMLGLAAIPASIVTGLLCKHMRAILWLSLSGGLVAGLSILALLTWIPLSFPATVLVLSLLSWGHSQVIVTIMSLAALAVPQHSTAKTMGIVFTVGYAGSIVSTYLGGYLVTATGEFGLSFLVFAASAIMASLVMIGVYRSTDSKLQVPGT